MKQEALVESKRRMRSVLARLKKVYPDSSCSLRHETPFQLLAATILSAQCTDERVNKVTPALFARFPDARAMSQAELGELERLVQSTGFYKNKALALRESAREIVERHDGQVPNSLAALTSLRGVGRKTANVVLGNAFGIPGLVVDTHVTRLCNRLGFVRTKDAEKIEAEMMPIVAKKDWVIFSHLLIDHGRARCDARKPDCAHCEISKWCPRVTV